MKLFIVLLAVLSSDIFAAPNPNKIKIGLAELAEDGRSPIISGRIVGGSNATYGQIPYIVSVQFYGSHLCGGVIISTTRILTAAHCFEDHRPSLYGVRADSLLSNSGGQLVGVNLINVHPGFDEDTMDNDVAVMHLVNPLDVSPAGVAVIGMPTQGAEVADGTLALVSGWGRIREDGPFSQYKLFVSVPVISNAECITLVGNRITTGMLCAGVPQGGEDACDGDSGGPLSAGGVLIGIVSAGFNGCARPNIPGVYARVAYYRDWIDAH